MRYEWRKIFLNQAHDFRYQLNSDQLLDMNHFQLTRPKSENRTLGLKIQKQTSPYLVLRNGRRHE